MSKLTTQLIAKELYLNRWLIIGAVIGGVLSVYLASTSKMGFNIGGLAWLTIIIAMGVVLPLYGVHQERKDRSLLFALSLPLSGADYVRVKMMAVMLCFLIPWFVLAIAAVLLVVLGPAPDGLLPFITILCGFLLANFSLVLCGSLLARSEAVISAVVVLTNMGVTLFIWLVGGGIPEINKYMQGPAPVWNQAFWTVLIVELAVLGLALVIPWLVLSRRRSFL
jgi:ABC-2 type transport system permease protein